MIETIYNSEDNKASKADINIRLPKNIRQIGQSDSTSDTQIYIEENVLAFIKNKPKEQENVRYGVLLGDKKQGNGYTYIFINGLIEVEDVIEQTIFFSDDIWTGIYGNIRKYYKNVTIVGWFASSNEDLLKDIHSLRKLHLDNFAGYGKVYLNVYRDEDEEAFYLFQRNSLRRQNCYHVYFEKSSDFEDYLFGEKGIESVVSTNKANEKSVGKYGIAINNIIKGNDHDGIDEKTTKESSDVQLFRSQAIIKYKNVASFVTILALAGVIGFMGKEGRLSALGNRMSDLVGGIINKEERATGDIISVNGNLSDYQLESKNGDLNKLQNEVENDDKEKATSDTSNDDKTNKETKADNATDVAVATEQETNKKSNTPETTTEALATTSIPGSNYEMHVVQAGETLYSIAMKKYGKSDMIDEIVKLNKLKNENIVIEGQKIFLP